ncbi:hypothetical protein MATR_16320 [Marivirga tractuosa]|uniref:Proprotein convertase P n=1 Tax=Marivirga tractuosa (strain ATCC 23168 / DSM 4126 / NBRC 15989 / NCIMB 1408 / VKM B-1430 / H-43) TaxID=643867 RepID=E4TRZ1_MARTH|nr:zinc-dependent metalloprotease family protein [Marivirga tractuosa]ADR20742.1 Proprotein convertase P [Marivirga tractuosa DSM 4126]BDD14807.1 hypothetical protein MATR_16320 [Marivirga tractuosa]
MKKLLPLTLLLTLILITFNIKAQKSSSWVSISVDNTERMIPVKKQKDFKLKVDEIKSYLKQSGQQSKLSIPYPNGNFKSFNLKERQIMEPALAAKFPNIKVYVGRNPETGDNVRISIGKDGFHAMVFSKEGTFFIDPVSKSDNLKHQVYYKKDLDEELINKNFYEEEPIVADQQRFEEVKNKVEAGLVERPSGTELRTYRLAVATTGEYTQFHGGTVEDAMSAIVTTMNRVNGIYERDIAVTMVLVDNNDQLIYTDASTDPFTNDDAGSFIDEVQADITSIIGSANFDIGHGFSTGAGGLASLGSVCVDSRKASGVTGRSNPVGDPYDVDYVAHEIGHQFGAPHTFNGVVGSCAGNNRSASSAYEPGSGTTIMAYAGICGSDNIQENSDAYFHAASLDYMTAFSQQNDGNSCAQISSTGNNLPIVEAGQGGFTIPINTPFQLNGSATDPDGDGLSYTWEQFDLGPAGNPNTPEENAPIFRSFEPTADSFRIFPQLSDILNGTQSKGEILPSYARDLNFRLTVRDDQPIGAVDYDDLSLSVTDQAGPFVVEEFTGDYVGYSSATVTWQVNGTDLAPINTNFVDIYVSTDGGNSFTEKVVEQTPNDGSQVITMPNVNTSTAKIKVMASNNVFFNISTGSFSITETTEPTFTISLNNDSESYCPSEELVFTLQSESILDFNESIELSFDQIAGLNGTFDNSTISPGESTKLRFSNANGISGEFMLVLNASAGSTARSIELPFTITNNPITPTITYPTNQQSDLPLRPTFTWEDNNIESAYSVEIATDPDFLNIVSAGTTSEKEYTVQEQLQGNTIHYMRIKTTNNCGESNYASVSFTTAAITCRAISSTDLPKPIASSSPNTVQSSLNICLSGIVEEIKVTNVIGTHSYISDLTLTLVSPKGTEVVLMANECGSEDDFNLSFSDDAESSNLICPPNDGGIFQPQSPLSALIGEAIQGEWILKIEDAASEDGGELLNWDLELCIGNFQDFGIDQPTGLTAEENEDDGSVLIEWTDNADNETGYTIERSDDDSSNFIELESVGAGVSSYVDNAVKPESIYFYRVKPFNDNCEGGYSEAVTIETLPGVPETPTSLVVTIENDYTAKLSWIDNATNETAYFVERSVGTEAFERIAELNPDTKAFEEVVEIGQYTYRVQASNDRGDSEYSNEVTIDDTVLSMNDELLKKVMIFPNPAKDVIYIKNESTLLFNKVQIRNSLGQLIKNETIIDQNQQIEIPVHNLAKGLYLIHINAKEGEIVKQIIIE